MITQDYLTALKLSIAEKIPILFSVIAAGKH